MGKFLDSIIEMAIKKHESNFEKEQKKIVSSAKSYNEAAVDSIKKAAKKGLFYTSITIKGENSLIIAHMVEKKLVEEGFKVNIKTGMINCYVNVSWAPFLYNHIK